MIRATVTNWPHGRMPARKLLRAIFRECMRRGNFDWGHWHEDMHESPLLELERRQGIEQCTLLVEPSGRWFMKYAAGFRANSKPHQDGTGQLYMGPDEFWLKHDARVLLETFFP